MAEWFAMGGYAGFVWPAWGATVIAFVGITIWFVADYVKAKREADLGTEK